MGRANVMGTERGIRQKFKKAMLTAVAGMLAFSLCLPAQALGSTSPALSGDLETVETDAIKTHLFNYSQNINKNADGTWRDFVDYFSFRGNGGSSATTVGGVDGDVPNPGRNDDYDADGFTENHATVLRTLDANGNPSLDPARKADGTYVTDGISPVSLAYLFDPNTTDHAVTAYTPANSMLVKQGNHYYYNSRENAVDFDIENNVFRVRNYVERNSSTASSCTASDMYGDYLPFNYTGGTTVGQTSGGIDYQVESSDVDYWFGTTIEVDFYQLADGQILGSDGQTLEDMIFSFSGDDDVWVFVDDVLVLDLGGTHGTVNGTINFATGEIQQYLTWGGKDASNSETSFPTTLRACYEAAGATPNGGWSDSGETFADFSKHTLKFFYLERGSSVANCKLDFNLPVLPDGDVAVTKALSGMEDESVIPENAEFRFVLYDGETREPIGGAKYSLTQAHAIVEGLETSADGRFVLRPYETATFELDSEKSYYVVELDSDEALAENCDTTTSGSVLLESEDPNVSDTFMPDPDSDGATEVVFTNTLKGHLEISKQVTGDPSDLNKDWTFDVVLSGESITDGQSFPCVITDESGAAVSSEIEFVQDAASGFYVGSVALKHGETAKISRIPAYTEYSVSEVGASVSGGTNAEGYETTVEGNESGTIKPGITSSVAFTNAYTAPEPISFQLEVEKLLEGSELKADMFSFVLAPAPDSGSPMPEGAEGSVVAVNDESGSVIFPEIWVEEGDIEALCEGSVEEVVYSYWITEEPGIDPSYASDAQTVIATVVVKKTAANELEAKVSYEKTGYTGNEEPYVFVNTYTLPSSAQLVIEGLKTLEGGDLVGGQFQFALQPLFDAPGDKMVVTNRSDGTFVFNPVVFELDEFEDVEAEKTYFYEISEIDLDEEGYTYDDRVYVVAVKIGKNVDNQLEIREVEYQLGNNVVDSIQFENVYDEPLPETGLPETGDGVPVAPLLLAMVLVAGLAVTAFKKRAQIG